MNKLAKILFAAAAAFGCALPASAQIASDSASNYTSWSPSSPSLGTGFGAWSATGGGSGYNGAYFGTNGGFNYNDFSVYAGPGDFENVQRMFGSALTAGETFSVEIGYQGSNDSPGTPTGFDSAGSIGISLIDASGNTVLNLNLAGPNDYFTLNSGGSNFGIPVTPMAGVNGVTPVSYIFRFTYLGGNAYDYSFGQNGTSTNTSSGNNYTFSVTPDNISGVRVYSNNEGPNANAGFDNLQIAPKSSTILWQGHTWTLRSATDQGPGPNNFNPNNVFVDANEYLHLLITPDSNSPNGYDCAELNTADNMGFGTYQWQITARTDLFDPWVVLGLFPYGPPVLGPDGTNEIDIEYAKWGITGANDGSYTVYPVSPGPSTNYSFPFSLSGGSTTSRFTWSATGVQYWLMGGFQPIGTTTNVIDTWNFTPANPSVSVPQGAMPLHMNLWLFQGHAPSNGQPVEVIIRLLSVALAEAPIQSWRMQNFGFPDNTGNGADTANPAGDGVPNLMKYALGMNPWVNSLAGLPVTSSSSGFLTMQFNRNLSATDITYAVEASNDMKAWTTIASLIPGASSWSLSGASVTDTAGAVTVVDQTAITTQPSRFLKVVVTGT